MKRKHLNRTQYKVPSNRVIDYSYDLNKELEEKVLVYIEILLEKGHTVPGLKEDFKPLHAYQREAFAELLARFE